MKSPAHPNAKVVYEKTYKLKTVVQIKLKTNRICNLTVLGKDLNVEEGYDAARQCAISLLAQLKSAVNGDLNKVTKVVKLGGFVNSAPDFTEQPSVINGASDLLVELFGEKGRHARTAVGANLPLGVAVEIDGIFEVES